MSSRRELSALADKYRRLFALRVEHERTGKVADRNVLRALAAEFPGALRELDRLPLDEIERRAEALTLAASGGPVEPWMRWCIAYHALLRAALFVKAEVAKGIAIDEELAGQASAYADIDVDADLLRTMAKAPRVSRAALDEVARRFGQTREEVERVLLV